MAKHLSSKHAKVVKPNAPKETNQQKLTDLFFNSTKKRKANNEESIAHLQYIFNRQIALWMCRDLLSFSTVTKEGFIDFWSSTKHTPELILPCRGTIAISALDDLYDCFRKKIVEILSSSPDHGTITFDCWTDSAKRTAYVTYTYHYMHDWTIRTAVLKTAMLAKPHTAERLKENFECVVRENELTGKNITVVTDGGANVVKACRLIIINRFGCIAHILHNVISKDLMKNVSVQVLIDLMGHIKQIQRKLIYKHAELKSIHDTEQQRKMWAALEEFRENGEYYR